MSNTTMPTTVNQFMLHSIAMVANTGEEIVLQPFADSIILPKVSGATTGRSNITPLTLHIPEVTAELLTHLTANGKKTIQVCLTGKNSPVCYRIVCRFSNYECKPLDLKYSFTMGHTFTFSVETLEFTNTPE